MRRCRPASCRSACQSLGLIRPAPLPLVSPADAGSFSSIPRRGGGDRPGGFGDRPGGFGDRDRPGGFGDRDRAGGFGSGFREDRPPRAFEAPRADLEERWGHKEAPAAAAAAPKPAARAAPEGPSAADEDGPWKKRAAPAPAVDRAAEELADKAKIGDRDRRPAPRPERERPGMEEDRWGKKVCVRVSLCRRSRSYRWTFAGAAAFSFLLTCRALRVPFPASGNPSGGLGLRRRCPPSALAARGPPRRIRRPEVARRPRARRTSRSRSSRRQRRASRRARSRTAGSRLPSPRRSRLPTVFLPREPPLHSRVHIPFSVSVFGGTRICRCKFSAA